MKRYSLSICFLFVAITSMGMDTLDKKRKLKEKDALEYISCAEHKRLMAALDQWEECDHLIREKLTQNAKKFFMSGKETEKTSGIAGMIWRETGVTHYYSPYIFLTIPQRARKLEKKALRACYRTAAHRKSD